jgi:hypothetical protein
VRALRRAARRQVPQVFADGLRSSPRSFDDLAGSVLGGLHRLIATGEPISLETVLFAAAVVATVLIAQRMRVNFV